VALRDRLVGMQAAVGRPPQSGQHLQQAGLAAAVGAAQVQQLTAPERGTESGKQHAVAAAHREAVDSKHGMSSGSGTRREV
jgi:hypothetical protein